MPLLESEARDGETAQVRRQMHREPSRPLGAGAVTVAALTLITLGGAALRFLGVSWGLPIRLHPDEWVIVNGAIDMASRNSFEPGYFLRPDHVEMQFSYLAYVAYAHLFHGVTAESLYAADPAPFVLISRSFTALAGTAMIILGYLIGRRFSPMTGLLTAGLVAFFPLYVEHSHYATPDVPLSLAFMVVMYGCMRYLEKPAWGNLLLACLGVAVATAIKYPGALSSLAIAVSLGVSAARTHHLGRLLTHGAVAVAGVIGMLFAISPVLFTNMHGVVEAIRIQARNDHVGADGLGWMGNLGFYVSAYASAAGVLVFVFAALGAFWSVRRRLLQAIPLSTGVMFWLVLSALPLHWERWGLPMFLSPLILAAIGLDHSSRHLFALAPGWTRRVWARGGAIALVGLVAVNLVLASVATTAVFLAPDTRVVSTSAIADMGIDVTNSVYEGYTPLVPEGPAIVFDAFEVDEERLVLRPGDGERRRYLMISSGVYDKFMGEPRYVEEQRFYAMVDEQYPLLATFEPAPRRVRSAVEVLSVVGSVRYLTDLAAGGYVGPTIKIFEIREGVA